MPEVPEEYRERFAESGWRVLEHAIKESRRRYQNYVGLEHFINALAKVEADLFDAVMLDLGVDAREVRTFLRKRMSAGLQHRDEGFRLAPELNSYLKRAWRRARNGNRAGLDASDILIALAEDKRGLFVELLRSFGADADSVAWFVYQRVGRAETERTRSARPVYEHFIKPRPKMEYAVGDTVRIKSGPFASFTGKVEEVFKEASKLKVAVNIFGHPAALELSLRDVEKITFTEGH